MSQKQQDINGDLVIAAVNEFYTTNDSKRRHELDTVLCRFKSDFNCLQTVAACMRMISSRESSANVRYFGTVSLYDVIRLRSEECISDVNIQMSVKTFLIENLTAGTYAQTQSVLNKLSSTLALLALYCIPDLWTEPVADMTALWAATPELLLKVLSDMAAEFSHVTMPLNQRSKLKTELHKISEDIIKIIWTVLSCGDATASTKQAAVDCVEQWIRLPGVALENWSQVLSVVLEAVMQDCTALTNILDILSENDELSGMHQTILDISNYIVVHVSQKIAEELEADGCSEEVASLVSATCCLAEKSVPTLVDVATQAGNPDILSQIIEVMKALSNLPGQYPINEKVSDLPSVFFTTLREEIGSVMRSEKKAEDQIISSIAQSYAQVLSTSINKLTYPPDEIFRTFTQEDQELFGSYRKTRSEVSVDCYYLSGSETLPFLNSQLEQSLAEWNINRSESILYLWECVADYLNETDYESILKLLQLLSDTMIVGTDDGLTVDTTRRAITLMKLFYSLSHLIQEHERATELEEAVIRIIVSYIPKISEPKEALNTLEKYLEDRPDSLENVGEMVSQVCYDFFNNTNQPKKLRLSALKCIGYVLSRRKPSDTMKIICQILNEHVGDLDSLNGLNDKDRLEKSSFQINIFSALFGSLTTKKNVDLGGEEPTIVLILREAIPVFEKISKINTGRLIDDVCDAIRSALTALPDSYVSLFFPFVVQLLNSALLSNAVSACTLAKATVLQCGSLVGEQLVTAICEWFDAFEKRVEDPQLDEWVSLIYQIVKKDWKTIRRHGEQSVMAITSALNICSFAIVQSAEPTVVRTASLTLASIASHTTSNDDVAIKNVLAGYGSGLIKAIFARVQCELMRQTVEALAEVLFFYFKQFTTETREVINSEPYGSTPLVAAMFRDIGNLRNFKQMTIRFNNAAIRESTATSMA